MALAGRNDPCPCGSGRKFKKCCGFDRAAERVLEDRLDALEQLARLAYLSPRLVPLSDAFDAWALPVLAAETRPTPEEGIATLDVLEIRRVVDASRSMFQDAWDALAPSCESEHQMQVAVLTGAVAAGLLDLRPPAAGDLAFIEDYAGFANDPFKALSAVLEGPELWDADDSREISAAIGEIPEWVDDETHSVLWHQALDQVSAHRMTDWHLLRLNRLVSRVAARLPFDAYPVASQAIAAGCERYFEDGAFRARLASTLLSDMLDRPQLDALRTLRAA